MIAARKEMTMSKYLEGVVNASFSPVKRNDY
jgi:hypothetical protein